MKPQRTFDYERAVKLRKEGRSYREIGEALGVSAGAAYNGVNPKGLKSGRARGVSLAKTSYDRIASD